ncbi:MAG TPA: ribulose-phosphate 3-epimerase [Chloroflexi bacterium]|nr:ribulose-phosphate 3-epimerase [Chloroflexota bacterium]
MSDRVLIAPSILSADFARLGEEVKAAEAAGADWIHVDVMDGHFVPNISFGPLIVSAIRPLTSLPLDVHLMITDPDRYLEAFARAGADRLIVHIEACIHIHRTIQNIRRLGLRAGVALNPGTPTGAITEIIEDVDLVMILSVNPGFGGQTFIERSVVRVEQMRRLLDAANPEAYLEVDGGINPETAGRVVAAGANVLVAGNAIFKSAGGIETALRKLRQAAARQGTN